MNEKVSVIVPVYNAKPYLHRCVDSLLAQTYENTEIILIDDGSGDGSGELCGELAREYEKIRVIHMENGGVSAARNRGMEAAAGSYLTFVDADDRPAADMIEYLVCLLERTDSDVAGCGYTEFGSDGSRDAGQGSGGENHSAENHSAEDHSAENHSAEDHSGENHSAENHSAEDHSGENHGAKGRGEKEEPEILTGVDFMEKGILKSDTRCWSKLYRRESLGGLRFDTGLTIGEDMLFLLRLAKEGKRFARGGYRGYGYFINDNGAMMGGFKDSYMDQITCWQAAMDIIAAEAPSLTDRAAAILLISVMLVAGKLSLLSARERREKKQYTQKCIRLIKKYAENKSVYRELDRSYRIKVSLYRHAPSLYMTIYHCLKKS